jgi:exopolysaccharide production protein ExoQ
MPPEIAAVVYALGIMVLFALDRERKSRTSKALWIPVAWLWIAGSREVSQWLAALGVWQAGTLSGSPDHYVEGNPIDRAVYTGLSALGMIVLFRRGPEVRRLLRANAPILLFFLYCAASILWSDYPEIAFKRWIKALGDVVMLTVVLTDPNRSAAVERLLTRTGFLLIPLSVLLIKYYPELGKEYKAASGTPVYSGSATNKNMLGITCLIFGLGSVWRFLSAFRDREEAHRSHRLIAHGTLLAMVLWLFWMANSMTSFCCFLLASGLMVATSLRMLAKRSSVAHFLVATVVSVSLITLFFGLGTVALDTMGRDPTLTGRTAIWDLVLSLSGNPLCGTGFESFWLGPRLAKMWSVYWWHPNEAHNGYLEVYLNLGWIGLALLAILIMKGYGNVLDTFRRHAEVGQLRLAYFVVGVVYNFTEAGFRMLDPVWIAFLLAVVAVPGDWKQNQTASARNLETFSPELAPSLTEVPPSWNL